MAITLNLITLPPGLRFEDEFAWSPLAQANEYSLTGSLLVEQTTRLAGRPITLVGGQQFAWLTRSEVSALKALLDTGAEMTLTLHDARSFTVLPAAEEPLSVTPFDPAAHTALTAENFYGTHYSKARTWNAVPDTITYYDLPNSLTIYNVTAAGQPADGQTTGLYDTDKLNVYDKYAMFLHGNNGLSRIEGDGTGRILVIKDSYANCFAPYLTANYAQIDVVDFRNYNYGLDQLIADNDYDQILVLYSFDSFKSDPYLYRAGVAG